MQKKKKNKTGYRNTNTVAPFKKREKYLLLKLHIYVLKEYINVEQEQVLVYLDFKHDHVSYLGYLPFGIPISTIKMATRFYLRLLLFKVLKSSKFKT